MPHLLLQLKRSDEQQAALEAYVQELHNPGSGNFHRWLSAEQFGNRFGVAPQDLRMVRDWLEREGFRVNFAFPSKNVIDFSGNAGQVRRAFHTEIHRFLVRNVQHIANVSDPEIPAALEPVIAGIVALHDFHSQSLPGLIETIPDEDFGNGRYVAPADLATIYNFQSAVCRRRFGPGTDYRSVGRQ